MPTAPGVTLSTQPGIYALTQPHPSKEHSGEADMVDEPKLLIVTEDTTRDEIAEALTSLGRYAAHQQHHPDCIPWKSAHKKIDNLLDHLDRTPAEKPSTYA